MSDEINRNTPDSILTTATHELIKLHSEVNVLHEENLMLKDELAQFKAYSIHKLNAENLSLKNELDLLKIETSCLKEIIVKDQADMLKLRKDQLVADVETQRAMNKLHDEIQKLINQVGQADMLRASSSAATVPMENYVEFNGCPHCGASITDVIDDMCPHQYRASFELDDKEKEGIKNQETEEPVVAQGVKRENCPTCGVKNNNHTMMSQYFCEMKEIAERKVPRKYKKRTNKTVSMNETLAKKPRKNKREVELPLKNRRITRQDKKAMIEEEEPYLSAAAIRAFSKVEGSDSYKSCNCGADTFCQRKTEEGHCLSTCNFCN